MTAGQVESVFWLIVALGVMIWLARFASEVYRHRALSRRMDKYQAWLKACTSRPGGLTDMERHELGRVLYGQNPEYRGPWEHLVYKR